MSSSRQVLKSTAVPPPNSPVTSEAQNHCLGALLQAGTSCLVSFLLQVLPKYGIEATEKGTSIMAALGPQSFAGDFSTRCLTSFPELSNCSWPAEVDQLSSERHEGCRGISDTFPRSPFPYIECLECRLTGEGCSFHAPEPYGLRCQATHGEEKSRGGLEWNQRVRSKVEGFWSLGL